MTVTTAAETLTTTLLWGLAAARAPLVRPMSQWVEDEIVLPNGPYGGQRYRHRYHPVSRLWFGALDSGRWRRFAACGPTQNGKTLMCYIAPVLYHLFEQRETVIVGLPSMDMANDKWSEDFLPVIEASRYRDLMPDSGEGSRGGQVKRSIHFKNGATLRFMSAGGGDKKRAGYTSRLLAITEADGMDEPGEASREADKIEQLEGRTRAYGDSARIYLECTASIETGRIWQEIRLGTGTRIARPCPHCRAWVTPEREHLRGWQGAQSEGEAREQSRFHCPSCDAPWTEAERWSAAAQAKLVHAGQEIDAAGVIAGDEPAVQTFGLRWSAIDNPFARAGQLGAEEWKAARAANRESANRKMRQFVWCLPDEPLEVAITPLEPATVEAKAATEWHRGVAPSDTIAIVVGSDTGKRALHWVAVAVRSSGDDHVLDFGRHAVDSETKGTAAGLRASVSTLADYFDEGWTSATGLVWSPAQVWMDSGWHEHTDAVYGACADRNEAMGLDLGQEQYRPCKGYGEDQRLVGRYQAPTQRSRDVLWIGEGCHLARLRRNGRLVDRVIVAHVDGDVWKTRLHERLAMSDVAVGSGCLTLFRPADPSDLSDFASSLCAERRTETFVSGRGVVRKWERVSRNNHYLDALYYALAAAQFVREKLANKTPANASWYSQTKGVA